MTQPPKARVREAFERAAPTYEQAASVQRKICMKLLTRLPDDLPSAPRILDAGCGTGQALPGLQRRFPASHALALDFSPAMLSRVPPGAQRVCGDLEALPLAGHSLDLYWSSLAVQWCRLPAVLAEARRTLRPGGCLALATLGPGTFHELRTAFATVDRHQHTLYFHEAAAVAHLARQAGFAAVDLDCTPETAHYADFRQLLRAVKAVGANQLGEGRRTALLGRGDFARAEAAMEQMRQPDGLPLSYDVLYLIARP